MARDQPCLPSSHLVEERLKSGFANVIAGLEGYRGRVFVERNSDGVATCGKRLELIAQHPPDHQNAAVALAKMLLRMNGDRTLANLRLIVAGKALVFLLGHVPPEFAVEL